MITIFFVSPTAFAFVLEFRSTFGSSYVRWSISYALYAQNAQTYRNTEISVPAENKNPSTMYQNALSFSEKSIAKKPFQTVAISTIEQLFPCQTMIPTHLKPKPWFSHTTNRIATITLHRLRSGHNRLNGHQSKYTSFTILSKRL